MLKGRSLLSLRDYTAQEINYLLDLSAELKEKKKKGVFEKRLEHKNIALIFEKPSTRTRCAFTVACVDEGAHPEYLGKNDIQLGHKESVADTARVLGRMFDGIEFRGFLHRHVTDLARFSGVPVWNGLTDDDHPTQALADLLTVRERFGKIAGVSLLYIGDGRNNVSNALMIAASKMGMRFRLCTPGELNPSRELLDECLAFAKQSGGMVEVVNDPVNAVRGMDAVYTDVWVSMGEEAKAEDRLRLLRPYQVNEELMSRANSGAVFMHCLPAVKGYEVTEGVFESPQSAVFDEAENRMHTIKAVMVATLGC